MKSNLIEAWLQDGLVIASRYQEKISQGGINSAKSLGERTGEKDWRFHSRMFEDVSLNGDVSILDIGCGKAELIPFLKNNYSKIKIDRYLGIDLVDEFLHLTRVNYPEHEFQQINFISEHFQVKQKFTLVVAQGVLVSRVSHHLEYVEYFIRKMVRCCSAHVLFNVISEIDFSSQNYLHHEQVGHSTSFSKIALKSILDKIENTSYRILESQIFPDATDIFVHILIE
ncbi:trans-aconitate 2-methyltransferase [Pleurocapsa sp. PCC 7319]|uniref:class I SAM-dependent methyltransferase n=1 Tax=Pleurocapsa sp. PCC 7319 TaxID=118161 RepID=UPI000382E0D7|nr:methyltransferase domain-containing protein [Pleurocapsa sp. PCC 7319]